MSSPRVWTKERVAGFLLSVGVDESDTDSAAAALLGAGYETEKYLLSARSEHLEQANIPLPVIDVILAHQEEVRQLKVSESNRNETQIDNELLRDIKPRSSPGP